MGENAFITSHVKSFAEKYPIYKGEKDYIVFTAMCIEYFYYQTPGSYFDPETVLRFISDGANDGGIDAALNDESSDGNDLILIQSKFYNSASVTQSQIIGEFSKIAETVKKLDKFQVDGYSQRMVSAYKNAVSNMEEEGKRRVVFFTSDSVPPKRDRNKMQKTIQSYFEGFIVELYFAEEIQDEIELAEITKTSVEYDELKIDDPDNMLKYNESVIVNVSAKSLQDLQNRRRNSLLGMNLRYHVVNQKVDSGIESTIKNNSTKFWYMNNGILIVCDRYNIDKQTKTLGLTNFSIVNGGQTTYKIGNTSLPEEDFYLQCKIVKNTEADKAESEKFVSEIAEATNSQKPIKPKDLRANSAEQRNLRQELGKVGVYYINKTGDKAPKSFVEPYTVTGLEKVGKVSLAGVLQMPGSARSNSQRMFQDANYYQIFRDSARPQFIADLLKLDYLYDRFTKSDLDRFDEKTSRPMIRNGRTFVTACIALLAKVRLGVVSFEEISNFYENPEKIKPLLKKMDGIEQLFKVQSELPEDFNKHLENLFGLIGDEVLGNCFEDNLDRNPGQDIQPSDYLKSDNNYYKDIIKRLRTKYGKEDGELRKEIDLLIVGK